jgi:hypothetical protein
LEEKDAFQRDPFLAETQKFCAKIVYEWHNDYAVLARFQRSDGSWTAWSGFYYDRVAALGFKPWVNPKIPKASNMSMVSYATDQPWTGSADASTQGPTPSSTSNAGEGIVQLSQGQAMPPFAVQPPHSTYPTLSTGQLITNDHDQGVWWPTLQLTQTDLFPDHEPVNNWIPHKNGFMQPVNTATNAPMGPLDFNDFSTELTPPVQALQPEGNIIGTSTNMFDCGNLSLEGIPGGLYEPADGSYSPAEMGQMMPEILNSGNGEYSDSFINPGFDSATWEPNNGGQGW